MKPVLTALDLCYPQNTLSAPAKPAQFFDSAQHLNRVHRNVTVPAEMEASEPRLILAKQLRNMHQPTITQLV